MTVYLFTYFPVCVTYPWTSDSSAWCLLRGGGGCALGIRSIVVTPKDQVVFKKRYKKNIKYGRVFRRETKTKKKTSNALNAFFFFSPRFFSFSEFAKNVHSILAALLLSL